ncbi:MAG: Rrf2 family transcriptional regulator [Phycisphaerales bacterium]|nr:MAG: Rrf2 family transcriptional regulator [Phycisphaerales bacterium]
MKLSRKCQYALKAVFELAWRNPGKPVKTCRIAEAQRMSTRFTETILNELKHGGYVESRRGSAGGYLLARDAAELTVREVIEYIQGPISLVPEATEGGLSEAFLGNEAFKELWQQVNEAVCEVCDGKTFADLVESERAARESSAVNYCI